MIQPTIGDKNKNGRRKWITNFILTLYVVFGSTYSFAQQDSVRTLEQSRSKILEEVFSSSVVLTDSDAVSFGIAAFDPDKYVDLGFDTTDEQSLALRKKVKIFALPWKWEVDSPLQGWKTTVKAQASYLDIKQDLHLLGDDRENAEKNRDQVYSVYFDYLWEKSLTERWQLATGSGVHIMRYNNDLNYNDDNNTLQPILDGQIFNTTTDAVLLEPHLGLQYEMHKGQWRWRGFSRSFYFKGKTISGGGAARPEGFRWENGFAGKYAFQKWGRDQHIRFTIKRVEMAADLPRSLGSNHYYNLRLGRVFSTPNHLSWLNNIGVGVSINIGTALSGGSLVILKNLD